MLQGSRLTPTLRWRGDLASASRAVAEETAIAIVCNGSTYAVMMATPDDLHDFAIGFCLTEQLIEHPAEIERFEIVAHEHGIECQLWLAHPRAKAISDRRRHMAGPTGCGLCGIESLEQAMRDLPVVSSTLTMSAHDIAAALAALTPAQILNAQTHAVHASGFWTHADGLVALREDVGRHNGLDKLVGALALSGESPSSGALLLTSRVSVEMVQKAAIAGIPIIIAVSAPTAKAIELADRSGITLVAIARHDGFEVFTHPDRLTFDDDRSHAIAAE